MRPIAASFFLIAALACAAGSAYAADVEEVAYSPDSKGLRGYLCRPQATGRLPAVLYNHGGMRDIIGGAPKPTCAALADAGFIGFSPIRRPTQEVGPSRVDVRVALDYLRKRDDVDPDRIAMIGFSRGGALTFMALAEGAPVKTAVIMAPAAPPAQSGFTLADAPKIKIPLFLIVAENDTGSKKTNGQNTIVETRRMEAALKVAGNAPVMKVYPPYPRDGHEMFEEVGKYWPDVVAFLKQHL